jgi:hypothetical protein
MIISFIIAPLPKSLAYGIIYRQNSSCLPSVFMNNSFLHSNWDPQYLSHFLFPSLLTHLLPHCPLPSLYPLVIHFWWSWKDLTRPSLMTFDFAHLANSPLCKSLTPCAFFASPLSCQLLLEQLWNWCWQALLLICAVQPQLDPDCCSTIPLIIAYWLMGHFNLVAFLMPQSRPKHHIFSKCHYLIFN